MSNVSTIRKNIKLMHEIIRIAVIVRIVGIIQGSLVTENTVLKENFSLLPGLPKRPTSSRNRNFDINLVPA